MELEVGIRGTQMTLDMVQINSGALEFHIVSYEVRMKNDPLYSLSIYYIPSI